MSDLARAASSQRAPEANVAEPASPAASRLRLPGWFDLRLLLGVLLVMTSVVVGARVVSAADDTVPVLVASADLAPGQPLSNDVVDTRDVLFDDVGLYHAGPVGDGYVVVRPVAAGELLPRAAVAPAGDVDPFRYVTVPVSGAEVPAELHTGDLVDVWVAPTAQQSERAATRLLADITVTGVSTTGGGLADSAGQAVVTLAVPVPGAAADESVSSLIAAARNAGVYLTRIPEGQQ